jgi:aryl carrier-like protein
LEDFWNNETENPTQFPILKAAFQRARKLRIFTKQLNFTRLPEGVDPRYYFLVSSIAATLLSKKQDPLESGIWSVDLMSLLPWIKHRGIKAYFESLDLLWAAIQQVQELQGSEEVWLFFGHDELQALLTNDALNSFRSGASPKESLIYKFVTEAKALSSFKINGPATLPTS